jgi:type IV pilus assembly protein PilP
MNRSAGCVRTWSRCACGRLPRAAALVTCLLAAGCGAPDPEPVEDWITRQRAQARVDAPTIAPSQVFTPQPYPADAGTDPFSSQRLTQALRRDAAQDVNAGLVRPEQVRPRQPLEAFPLDTMTLVGSLVRQGQPVALVRIDQRVYPVRIGTYLGQHYGKVVRITEQEVVLREIVQDASGLWTERATSLQLQERPR